jgi:hypothetical protein
MKRLLQAIHTVDGVQGSLVVDGNGQILAYQAHAVYDAELIEKVGQTIVSTVDSVRLLHEDWETLSASFGEGTLLLRSIKAGGAAAGRTITLAIIGDNRLNPSFAGVAMRVAATKLKTHLESPASAGDQSGSNPNLAMESNHGLQGSRPAPTTVSESMPPPLPGANTPPARIADLASSSNNWSGLGSSSKTASNTPTLDAESTAFVAALTKQLSTTAGPMAKVYVKESVRKLSADRPFFRGRWEALVVDVSSHIQDPVEAAQFQKAMRAHL